MIKAQKDTPQRVLDKMATLLEKFKDSGDNVHSFMDFNEGLEYFMERDGDECTIKLVGNI